MSRQGKRSGLQVIAAALAGHRFESADRAAVSASGLSSSYWMYVFMRIDRHEEGWKRNRGLSMLRRIGARRKDLKAPFVRFTAVFSGLGRLMLRMFCALPSKC